MRPFAALTVERKGGGKGGWGYSKVEGKIKSPSGVTEGGMGGKGKVMYSPPLVQEWRALLSHSLSSARFQCPGTKHSLVSCSPRWGDLNSWKAVSEDAECGNTSVSREWLPWKADGEGNTPRTTRLQSCEEERRDGQGMGGGDSKRTSSPQNLDSSI